MFGAVIRLIRSFCVVAATLQTNAEGSDDLDFLN